MPSVGNFFFVADDQELQLEKDKIKTLNGTVVYWVVLRWCVSLILTPIFSSQNHLYVLLFVFAVIFLASFEVWERTKYTWNGMFWWVLFSMFLGNAIVGFICVYCILQVAPVWDPA